MSIIDSGKLEAWIVKIESLFLKDNLTQPEQQLIIQQVNARITTRVTQVKSKDLFESMMPKFAKKFIAGQEDGTE